MTGHPDSPSQSPSEDAAGCTIGSPERHLENSNAMHTLALAQSPHQPILHHLQNIENSSVNVNCIETDYALPVPMAPAATPVQVSSISMDPNDPSMLHQDAACGNDSTLDIKVKFETLRSMDQKITLDMDTHMSQQGRNSISSMDSHPSMMLTSELLGLIPGDHDGSNEDIQLNEDSNDLSSDGMLHSSRGLMQGLGSGPKTWSQQDMENALDALRNHNMSLTKASSTYGIPSTTLWQRAHRLGIDTPKKEGPSKSWSEGNLHSALQALRTGTISANKASKAYGIPSSTLYKIARREGIRLAAPFNAAPTAWRPGDLERALHSIRSGHSSVQRASTEFGIPTGTLYGRCKREGIELSRSNPTPWSEDAMGEALEAVRIGQMSINQAAIHYNLPYSSLYGRFKRCKYEGDITGGGEPPLQSHPSQEHHNSHQQMVQQSGLGHHSAHIQDHPSNQDGQQRHLYSVYHNPIPVSIHEHSDQNILNHSNQDCIPIS